jgi:hypothetical protein
MMNGAHVFVLCLQVDGPIVSWEILFFKRFKKDSCVYETWRHEIWYVLKCVLYHAYGMWLT